MAYLKIDKRVHLYFGMKRLHSKTSMFKDVGMAVPKIREAKTVELIMKDLLLSLLIHVLVKCTYRHSLVVGIWYGHHCLLDNSKYHPPASVQLIYKEI